MLGKLVLCKYGMACFSGCLTTPDWFYVLNESVRKMIRVAASQRPRGQ